MSEYLFLDGSCGISGDMMVAALLDLGANEAKLNSVLKSLRLDGFDYQIAKKNSYSISGCDFNVLLHQKEHVHEEEYHEHHHEHHHEHRHLSDVYDIIDKGEMTSTARDLAKKIFLIVAEAEAKAHGCSLDEVHFHEVGAIDSIVDIIAIAVLIDDLAVNQVIVNGLCEGKGFVECQHGRLPVPVPAVVNIAQKYGIILHPSETNGEMVTPTGIAAVAALKTIDKLPSAYKIIKTGIGLGKRDFGRANFLRAMIIDDVVDDDQVYIIETNIDDSTSEELGLTMEKLMSAGARDVHFEPCFMKKNRPAFLLRVVTSAKSLSKMEEIIFSYTSTIGLRKYPVERRCMERKILNVTLPYGVVEVKKCWLGNIVKYNPEYESVKKIAELSNLSFRKVFDEARMMAEKVDNA